jgi:hypothetical protein
MPNCTIEKQLWKSDGRIGYRRFWAPRLSPSDDSRMLTAAQANAYAMVRRRAAAAGFGTKIGMANHASTRTTQLYDRRRDDMSLDEVEWIRV